jgi:Ca2+-binding EF-hand superfamily protein
MLTAFQETKLKYLFHLLDKNKSGVLEPSDFSEIGDEVIENFNLSEKDLEKNNILKNADKFFQKLISNISVADQQVITLDEWLIFFDTEIVNAEDSILTDEVVDLILNFLFGSFDQNRDGYTSVRDYIQMFSVLGISRKDLTSAFIKFDVNGDCKLSRYELSSGVESFLISDDQQDPGNWIFGPYDH